MFLSYIHVPSAGLRWLGGTYGPAKSRRMALEKMVTEHHHGLAQGEDQPAADASPSELNVVMPVLEEELPENMKSFIEETTASEVLVKSPEARHCL